MNIFENYLDKLIQTIKLEAKENNLILPDNLSSINVDVPPINFDYDISTNIAMVLSKPNKKSPLKLGETFINLIKKNDEFIENIDLAKPGFINIKFKNIFWSNFAKSIIDIKNYGSTKKNKKKYLFIIKKLKSLQVEKTLQFKKFI